MRRQMREDEQRARLLEGSISRWVGCGPGAALMDGVRASELGLRGQGAAWLVASVGRACDS